MAINAEEARVVHTANGVATFFSYAPIEGATASNLKVWLFNPTTGALTAQTLTTHYTFGSGGVTFLTPPPNGWRVILRREVPFTQPDVYTTNTPFPAKVTENRLDQIVMALQELKDDVQNRSVRLPLGDAGFSSSAVPAKEVRKGKLLGFDATSGDPIVYSIPGATSTMTAWGEGLISQANSAAGRAYIGATATGDALFTAASAASARTTLGATTVGDALFTATSAAAARSAMSAVGTGAITGSGLTVSTSPRLLGRHSTGGGAVEEIALGTGLSLSGSTLNATAGFPSMSSGRVLGRYSTGTGPAEELEAEVGSDPTMRVAGGVLRARRISDGELFIDRFNTSDQGGRLTFRRHSDNANSGQFRLWNSASGLRLGYFKLDPSPTEIFVVHHTTGKVSAGGNATADEDLPRYGQVKMNGSAATLTGSAVDITSIPDWATEVAIYVYNASMSSSARPCYRIGTATPATSGYAQTLLDMTSSAYTIYGSISNRIVGCYGTNNYCAYVRLVRRGVTWDWFLSSHAQDGSSLVCSKCVGYINLSGPINIVRVYPDTGTFSVGRLLVTWRA